MIKRTYTELCKIDTFLGRFRYLALDGTVGEETLGSRRILGQEFYRSPRWRRARDKVIIRDEGFDLGIIGMDVTDMATVHHMNPVTIEQAENDADELYDPEYLIMTSRRTHQAIHFGDESQLPSDPIERRPNDTSPWLNQNGSNSKVRWER